MAFKRAATAAARRRSARSSLYAFDLNRPDSRQREAAGIILADAAKYGSTGLWLWATLYMRHHCRYTATGGDR